MFGCLFEMHCSPIKTLESLEFFLHALFQDYLVNFNEFCSVIILKIILKILKKCSAIPTRCYMAPFVGGNHDSKMERLPRTLQEW